MDPIATANMKLSANRGTARLWLEGAKLAAAGFSRYDSYALVTETVTVRAGGTTEPGIVTVNVFKSVTGTGKVAGRPARKEGGQPLPIIDRGIPQWTALVGTHRLAVQYFPGMVVITPERIN